MNADIVLRAPESPSGESGNELTFFYGDTPITFQRLPRVGKNHSVLVRVQPDGAVKALAPEELNDKEVIAAVKKRARWVYKQLDEFQQQQLHITPRKFVSGETHYYLGKQYVLKVIEESTQTASVKLIRGTLQVTTKDKKPERIKSLLNEWYKEKAKNTFSQRLAELVEHTPWVSEPPVMRVQAMKTQWGSCSPHGRLTLNPHLVKAFRDGIDYVILHELCHIAEHNHSERFYRLLNQVMPSWKSIKSRLDANAHKYLGTL